MISLLQTFKRPFHGTQENSENHLVSFTIYKVSGDQIGKILDRDYITRHPYIARCNRWGKASEVSYRFVLTSGHYVVMPVTYRPNEEAEFLLRIFTEKPVEVSQEYWLYWH